MIKLRKLALSLGALLFSLSSSAEDVKMESKQSVEKENRQYTKIENGFIRKQGDSIAINFDVNVSELALNYKLDINPILYNDSVSIDLKSIVFGSFVKHTVDCRKSRRDSTVTYIRKDNIISYSTTIAYEEWMTSLDLRADRVIEAYGVDYPLPSIFIAEYRGVLTPIYTVEIEDVEEEEEEQAKIEKQIKSDFAFVHEKETNDPAAYFDNYREQGMGIHFKQGSAEIDPTYNNNGENLQKIIDAVAFIESIPDIELEKVSIVGTASPEGSAASNMRLAEDRATKLISYLKEIKGQMFEVNNIGEDWEGLRALVDASTISYRDDILYIIDNVESFDDRERQIMNIANGAPYRYMLKHYFTKLRSASFIQIFYKMKTNPDAEKEKLVVSLIDQKGYDDALRILEGLTVSMSTDNLKGICHMMLGDLDQARDFFNSAISKGSEHAKVNLEELESHQVADATPETETTTEQ